MVRRVLLSSLAVAALGWAAHAQTPRLPSAAPGAPDPFGWLEQIHGARAMSWVAQQNTRTAKVLEDDPRYAQFHREALAIFTAKERIPEPTLLGDGVGNLWQDADHPHGIWRVTSAEDYRSEDPHWRTLIDLDALSKAEGKSWFFKGATCLPPDDRLCLVRLSDGGGDAVEVREFDTRSGAFVEGGFHFPRAKLDVAWLDPDTVLVATDFGPGTLTSSGYPFVVKAVKRGQSLDQAKEVFRGVPTDVRASARVLRDGEGRVSDVLIAHNISFFQTVFLELQPDGSTRRLDLPRKNELYGELGGRLILSINEDWPASGAHGAFRAGDLIGFDPKTGDAELIFRPSPVQTIQAAALTREGVLVQMLDNVIGAVELYRPQAGAWSHQRLSLPGGSTLNIVAASRQSDRAYVSSESFLEPTALWEIGAADARTARVKALPAQFDASRDVMEQRFATSKDGTRIPYFLIRPKDMKPDGSTPVQMFGYGGFQLSETPQYRPEMGKLWLERGGAYVVANIRGGGEFGPAWHEAALREHRQRAFDDFAAVAQDLIATKVTSPRHLGIYGRSNGGVLTSVSITQHPDLFGAAVIESPLVDMLRYNHLPPGASWMAEYGDPDVPADRAFIAKYSAYTNVKPGVKYPEPYITTNTEDDRVNPAHARKFAAELEALGDSYLYYENTFGGHANDADPELNARRWARHYIFLTQKLMD
ncbi:MAG TPA: prolyl oligopeptidase family serine peptidase [Caulobacteraceae bacterium]|nr:prolyl oligopeptidase family serine peptidase [Caulobacteraceae bacterium]